MHHIVSFSGGKDSTAMLHLLLKRHIPISHVIHFECEWDFPQMEAHLHLVERNTGIRIVRIRYYRHFSEQLACYGWPKSSGGWCAASKHRTCLKYIRYLKGDKIEYIGFSADEVKRTQTGWMKNRQWPVKFPLIESGMGKADILAYCQSLGYHWDGLYDIFSRTSCFCCPKAGKKRVEKLRVHCPELYGRYLALDRIANLTTTSCIKKRRLLDQNHNM